MAKRPARVTVFDVMDGHGDHVALVTDQALADEMAAAVWGGRVRRTYVDDAAARHLLASLREGSSVYGTT